MGLREDQEVEKRGAEMQVAVTERGREGAKEGRRRNGEEEV